jgi:hypothetical protein
MGVEVRKQDAGAVLLHASERCADRRLLNNSEAICGGLA